MDQKFKSGHRTRLQLDPGSPFHNNNKRSTSLPYPKRITIIPNVHFSGVLAGEFHRPALAEGHDQGPTPHALVRHPVDLLQEAQRQPKMRNRQGKYFLNFPRILRVLKLRVEHCEIVKMFRVKMPLFATPPILEEAQRGSFKRGSCTVLDSVISRFFL